MTTKEKVLITLALLVTGFLLGMATWDLCWYGPCYP